MSTYKEWAKMKYYDVVISLGQYCITSLCLRRVHLQDESMVFDWSAGRLEEIAGKGGLAGKVDLICNDFKDFFNIEDFENWGLNTDHDCGKFLIINRRTGLQYKHDFPGDKTFEESFQKNKEKYERRVKRMYSKIAESNSILFVYMAYDGGFDNSYLIQQYQKLKNKFPNKNIDMLYIMHDERYDINSYNEYYLLPNIKRIDLNFQYPSDPTFPENWNGNKALYYPIVKKMIFTPVTIKFLNENIDYLQEKLNVYEHTNIERENQLNSLKQELYKINVEKKDLENKLNDLMLLFDKFKKRDSFLQQIFSVKNENNHKVVRLLGIKIKFRKNKISL